MKAFPAIKDARTSSLPIIPQVPVMNSCGGQHYDDSGSHIHELQSHGGRIDEVISMILNTGLRPIPIFFGICAGSTPRLGRVADACVGQVFNDEGYRRRGLTAKVMANTRKLSRSTNFFFSAQ